MVRKLNPIKSTKADWVKFERAKISFHRTALQGCIFRRLEMIVWRYKPSENQLPFDLAAFGRFGQTKPNLRCGFQELNYVHVSSLNNFLCLLF